MGSIDEVMADAVGEHIFRVGPPPNASVMVEQEGAAVVVTCKPFFPRRWKVRLAVFGGLGVLGALVCLAIWEGLLESDHGISLGWSAALLGGALALAVPAIMGFGYAAIAVMSRTVLRLEPSHLTVLGAASSRTVIPWGDIREISIETRGQRDRVVAVSRETFVMIKGQREWVELETSKGPVKVMDLWHASVVAWCRELLEDYRAGVADLESVSEVGPAAEKEEAKKQRRSRWQWITIGLLAFVMGGGFGVAFSFGLFESLSAEAWPSVQGEIIKAETITKQDAKDRQHIVYRYEVGQQSFESDRMSFRTGYAASEEREKREMVVGQAVTVWFNPEQPDRSVLKLGVPWFEVVMSGVCTLVGLGGLVLVGYASVFRIRWADQPYVEEVRRRKR
ncbi:MAG: DUF3592 domain-containing protein [Planctomycetota bacterium]